MTTSRRQLIEWRRNKINELMIKGFAQYEIADMLSINKSAVSKDVAQLRIESEQIIKNHIQKTLPFEFNNCVKGLQEIIKESWIIAERSEKNGDDKQKLQSLALIKECYSTKMELLTNTGLLQESIKFVENTKEKLNKGNGLERFTTSDITTEQQQSGPVF